MTIARFSDIQDINPGVSTNINYGLKIEPVIRQVEEDLRPDHVSHDLYFTLLEYLRLKELETDITNDPYSFEVNGRTVNVANFADMTEHYDVLINGGWFGVNGDRWCHGLRKAIACIAYAEILKVNSINVTAFGVVEKKGEWSDPANGKAIAEASRMAFNRGHKYLTTCVELIQDRECAVTKTTRPPWLQRIT